MIERKYKQDENIRTDKIMMLSWSFWMISHTRTETTLGLSWGAIVGKAQSIGVCVCVCIYSDSFGLEGWCRVVDDLVDSSHKIKARDISHKASTSSITSHP